MAQLVPRIIRGAHLDFFSKIGITQTQFFVLVAIHGHGRCAMGTLARHAHVSMPTISGVVGRLVGAGYVRRVPDAQDRRSVLVTLTVKGRTLIQRFQAVIQHRWQEVLKPLEGGELDAFHRVVVKLTEQLQREA